MNTSTNQSVKVCFFEPLTRALESAKNSRHCREFSDQHFLESGVGRVIHQVQSGRDWVQRIMMEQSFNLTVSNFFESLKSKRRLLLLEEMAQKVRMQLDQETSTQQDPLAEHEELNDFEVYASDGHYEQCSAHSPRDGKGRKHPSGFFYSLNLRTHSLSLLDVARPKAHREHDMTLLKRLSAAQLRLGAPKGKKVIHVYDRAGIDYLQWRNWKTQGLYMISREKENSAATIQGINDWSREDPRNAGVLSDELIGVNCGVLLRRVTYRCSETKQTYSFITNVFTLPPGLIAFLYRMRWDVEKVFDEKKNKLEEKKTWAKLPLAHCIQAHFVCLAHNLLVLLEHKLADEHGITDQKTARKREARQAKTEARLKSEGLSLSCLLRNLNRSTQRSLQFIRWLRYNLTHERLWGESLKGLRPLMEAYL